MTLERKKASDFPPEVMRLFDGYVHGALSRRDFLDRAGKYALGGLSAAAMLESLQPNFAWAQQVPMDDKRIKAGYAEYDSPGGSGKMHGYLAQPAKAGGKLPAVLVIHENRGLNPDLAAAVPYSGSGSQPAAADVPKIQAPLLIHYAGLDERINKGWPAYEAALKANNKRHTMHMYDGVNHGFHNDTTPRYDDAAAKLSWQRTLDFFNQYLRG